MPKEPNKRRPAVVVEDGELFVPDYPNVILVPLTEDAALLIPDLAVSILPTPGKRGFETMLGGIASGSNHGEGAAPTDPVADHGRPACDDPQADRHRDRS